MKIVINVYYGGFGLSRQAFLKLREMGNSYAIDEADFGEYYSDGSGPREQFSKHESFMSNIPRNDPQLVQLIEEFGAEFASGTLSKLKVVEIPDDVSWYIEEYDGNEHIAECHRTWS